MLNVKPQNILTLVSMWMWTVRKRFRTIFVSPFNIDYTCNTYKFINKVHSRIAFIELGFSFSSQQILHWIESLNNWKAKACAILLQPNQLNEFHQTDSDNGEIFGHNLSFYWAQHLDVLSANPIASVARKIN